jgi:ABC-type transport system involved in multi-copper enzyme maturation permease subunit
MNAQRSVPSLPSVIATLFGVTWKRLLRGRSLWVCALITILPALIAGLLKGDHDMIPLMRFAQFRVMAILPPILVASVIGEEIEDRTITYLWSRPIARWSLLIGRLATLAPVAAALSVVGWVLATVVRGEQLAPQELTAFALGSITISLISAAVSTLAPRWGMRLSIIYMLVIDPSIGEIPASIHDISVTKQVWLLSGLEAGGGLVTPLLTLASIVTVWLFFAFWRLSRLEA